MNLPTYVFAVDHVAKIRSELSITVLGKKEPNYRLKSDLSIQKSFLPVTCMAMYCISISLAPPLRLVWHQSQFPHFQLLKNHSNKNSE